jgi:predicted enzyme related to lactoylglutathione lyase
MPSDRKIDYIEFPASNMAATEQFYNSTFGWSFTSYGEEYQSFTDGNTTGGFFLSDLQSRTGNGAALIVLYADDLEATLARVIANGGSIRMEIFEFPGGRRFHFLDPNGNELAVWSDK